MDYGEVSGQNQRESIKNNTKSSAVLAQQDIIQKCEDMLLLLKSHPNAGLFINDINPKFIPNAELRANYINLPMIENKFATGKFQSTFQLGNDIR